MALELDLSSARPSPSGLPPEQTSSFPPLSSFSSVLSLIYWRRGGGAWRRRTAPSPIAGACVLVVRGDWGEISECEAGQQADHGNGSGEDDVVSSPIGNTWSFYHLLQLTKHKHSKSGYL
jgi:hypothetical protein